MISLLRKPIVQNTHTPSQTIFLYVLFFKNGQDLQTDDKLSKLFGKSGTFSTQNVSQLVKAHFKK